MNAREKFHAVMSFQDSASNMKTEFGYWAGTIRRWFEEGLLRREGIPDYRLDGDLVRGCDPISPDSDELVDRNVLPQLQLDSYLAKFPIDFSPPLESELLEENSHYRVLRDRYGITKKQVKDNAATHFNLEFPRRCYGKFYQGMTEYYHAAQSAIIADSLRPGRRAVGYASVNTLPNVVALVAPALGAYIIAQLGLELGMRYLLVFSSIFQKKEGEK